MGGGGGGGVNYAILLYDIFGCTLNVDIFFFL